MSLLELRRQMARKRRKFIREEYNKYKRLKSKWRKPYGNQSKLRMHKGRKRTVEVGFRGPAEVRGFHPSGLEEVLVYNLKQLEGLKEKAVRIAATVGKRKKVEIVEKAKQLKLKVINPGQKKEEPEKKVEEKPKKEEKITKSKEKPKHESKASKKAGE